MVLSNEEWMNSLRSERAWSERRAGNAWGRSGNDDNSLANRQAALNGVFRTVCVRLCDGYFFPISDNATRERLGADAAECQNRCPSGGRLFLQRTRDDADGMVDLNGQRYERLRTAYLYRTSYDPSCKCKPHPWEQEARLQHRIYALQVERSKGNRTAIAELKAISASASAKPVAPRQSRGDRLRSPAAQPVPATITAAGPTPALPPSVVEPARTGKATRTAAKEKALAKPMGLGASGGQPRGEEWRRKALGN
jgi:hypothetical protein